MSEYIPEAGDVVYWDNECDKLYLVSRRRNDLGFRLIALYNSSSSPIRCGLMIDSEYSMDKLNRHCTLVWRLEEICNEA